MIYRLTNEAVLHVPQIRDFLLRVMADHQFPQPVETLAYVAKEMSNPGCMILLGLENDQPVAACMAMLPSNPIMLHPQVLAAYNEGSRPLGLEMQKIITAWVKAAGHKKIIGFNRSGLNDKLWCRIFRPGGKPTRLGSMYEFEVD